MSSEIKCRKGTSLIAKYISVFCVLELVTLISFGGVLMYYIADTWRDNQMQVLLDYAVNASDTYESMLSTDMSADAYSGLCYTIAGLSKAADADIFITDEKGNVLFCKEMAGASENISGTYVCDKHTSVKVPTEIINKILLDGSTSEVIGYSGIYDNSDEESFLSGVKTDETDGSVKGVVFAIQPLNTGLRPYLTKYLQIYILSALAVLVSTALIIYVSTYNTTKPLKQISEATKRYAKGDFSYRIDFGDSKTVREFDDLALAFNVMADELETLENTRTSFVANVSHELKTPMTTISGFIDGILDGTIDKDRQNYYLEIVSGEVKRLSRLVISMLNMSKMESGELRLNPVKYDITQQIVGIFISLEQKIEEKKIDVKGLDRLPDIYIEADPDMINQVFYNLVDNAVKFTENSGEIEVRLDNNSDEVIFIIRNTGKGIDSEDIDHVFERFYKGDKSRSLDSKSAGLGLFIVKNIVELHNGEISVKNAEDHYTEFSVKLKKKLIGV